MCRPEVFSFHRVMAAIQVTANTSNAVMLAQERTQLSELGVGKGGRMFGLTVWKEAIISVLEYFGTRTEWTGGQLAECTELAYSEAYWFTLAELKQFISRVKTSYYQSNKNLSPPVFMGFLGEYVAEREQARYEHYSQQKPKETRKEMVVDEETQQRYMDELKKKANEIAQQMAAEPTDNAEIPLHRDHKKRFVESVERMLQAGEDVPVKVMERYNQLKSTKNV